MLLKGIVAVVGALILVASLLGLASWEREADLPAAATSVRLTGWDLSLVLPVGWVLTPAYSDGEQRLARPVTKSDDVVFFQAPGSTIYRGAGQPPVGAFVEDDFALIRISRSADGTVPSGASATRIAGKLFFYVPPATDGAGPDPDAGYFYSPESRPSTTYQFQFESRGGGSLEPPVVLETLREEP